MFTFIKQNKLLTCIVTIFVLAILYYSFFVTKEDSSALLSTSTSTNPSAQSQQLLTILANLRSIRLNDAVFRDPVFMSLNDFGVIITPQSVGRRNPFFPFAPEAITVTTTAVQQIRIPPLLSHPRTVPAR